MTDPYYIDDHVALYHGDCLDVLATLPDDSVDAVITDPPYLIGFMGRAWDASHGIAGQPDVWRDVGRVLKPGGHLLAFGAPRTYHRMAVAIEDAGFEIRDSLMWLFGSGFPKSHDIGKAIDRAAGVERETERVPYSTNVMQQGIGVERPWMKAAAEVGYHERPGDTPATPEAQAWDGWGTALKPAYEPIVLARKPLTGTVAANVLTWGVGGLNVDGCRIGTREERELNRNASMGYQGSEPMGLVIDGGKGRWPANVILDADAAAILDKQSGERPGAVSNSSTGQVVATTFGKGTVRERTPGRGDSGGASRFFYTPKADRHERPRVDGVAHPTVKPVDLIAYLVRLITPRGGLVLDPFAGTGTTAEAATAEGCRTILIEREADYLPLIMQRLQRPVEVTLL